ncbi:MAG: HlyC/CorC family transporter [Clostridia bacterium]|nr:HlyC/CorC family transporter [Clostridia bacterium]
MSDDSSEKRDRKKPKTSFAQLLGIKPKSVTEEEILDLIDAGEESGTVEEHEKNRIERIFDFTDRSVGDIMTHRIDITALEDIAGLDETVRLAIDSGYSRIPVYHGDIDTIIGVLYVKDLLKYVIGESKIEFNLSELVRKVPFIPKSKNCEKLFALMTDNKVQMAVVVDEYGGTEGLITLEDLVEAILGNIQDEFDDEDESIKELGVNSFSVDGLTGIEKVEELIGEKLDVPEDCDTVAAFILERLGRIPQPHEKPVVKSGDVVFTVEEIEDRRISSVLIMKIPGDGRQAVPEDSSRSKS